MEVHKHSHAEGANKGHFFREFIMLFLAVFCGYQAEYQLEHRIERDRERQFIISMIKELEADTARMSMMLKDTAKIPGIDSMVSLINTNTIKTLDVRAVYYLRKKYTSNVNFMQFNKSTLTQLKNAGNMRLIRNRNVVDSINVLDNLITGAEFQFALAMQSYQQLLAPSESGIFNDWYYTRNGERVIGVENAALYVLHSQVKPVFLTNNYKDLIVYANHIGRWRSYFRNYQSMIGRINNYSSRLILFLRKEYGVN